MTSPRSLLTTKGTATERRLPSAFCLACTPTQAHWGPQPPRLVWKTGWLSRRKLNASELSGLISAVHGSAAGAVEASVSSVVIAAQRSRPKPTLGEFLVM